MPGLNPPRGSAVRSRNVSYADLRASDLVIHHMPGHFIRRLQQVAVRLFFARVGLDMTPVQFAALAAVAHQPRIDQARLSELIGYDRATIGGVIGRLESRGWLARSASRADRRVRLVRITPSGRKALAWALPAVRSVQQMLLEPLDATERRHFERLCLKVLARHLG
jgi:MarR family transcriptional regulator, temperature-dependent positive regulator of motility